MSTPFSKKADLCPTFFFIAELGSEKKASTATIGRWRLVEQLSKLSCSDRSETCTKI
jgi:hypothetical protein